MKRTIGTAAIVTLLAATAAAAAGAVDLSRAVETASTEVAGEVIGAELDGDVYEVRIRTADGSVKRVYVSTADGAVVERKRLSLDDAVAAATAEVPGEVIKVEFERGRYEVKVRAHDGSVVELYVDAEDGAVVKGREKYYKRGGAYGAIRHEHRHDDED